jgi:HPt (histidine-containing phosphotransfer) domain-containing protein
VPKDPQRLADHPGMTADRVLAGAIQRRLHDLHGPTPAGAALVARLVDSYLTRAPAYLAGLDDAVRRTDPDAVARLAHGLGGVAGNLGAAPLAELCERLELARPDEFDELMGSLRVVYVRVARVFREITTFAGESPTGRSMIVQAGPEGSPASAR